MSGDHETSTLRLLAVRQVLSGDHETHYHWGLYSVRQVLTGEGISLEKVRVHKIRQRGLCAEVTPPCLHVQSGSHYCKSGQSVL